MLILTRKKGQSIIINDNIEIVISAIDGDQIKIGIQAPKEISIYRKEVLDAIRENNRAAVQSSQMNIELIRKLYKMREK